MRILSIIIGIALAFPCFSQIRGKVVDGGDGSAIIGAAVRAFSSDSVAVCAAATNADGAFSISGAQAGIQYVSVSFTGYDDAKVDVNGSADADLGVIRLQPASVMLEGVSVTAEMRRQNANTETFLLTDSIRSASPSAAMMIGSLPGFKVDWVSEDISYGQYRNVPIIVNGRKVGMQYAKSLNPKRIKSIQLQRYPPGEYSDEPVLINIVLFENYIGWDVSAAARGQASFRNRHSNSEAASADATLSTKEWNTYVSASFNRRDSYEAASFLREIAGAQPESTMPIDADNPNLRDMSHAYAVSAGADRKIGKRHTVSAQTWLERSSSRRTDNYNMASGLRQTNTDRYTSVNSYTGLYYQGVVGKRLALYSNLLYNYYDIDEDRSYASGDAASASRISGRKDYVYLMAYAAYYFSDRLDATLSYNYTWRKYRSLQESVQSSFVSKESRNKAEASIGYTPLKSLSMRMGVSLLDISTRQNGVSDSHTTWVPKAQLYWRPLKWAVLTGTYFNVTQFPNLDQLSPTPWLISAHLAQTGNPSLRSKVVHSANAVLTLFGWISLDYMWRKSNDDIVDWYEQASSDMVMKTYANCDYLHQYIGVEIDKYLCRGLNLKFTGNYQWYKRWMHESKNSGRTWYGDLTLTWDVEKTGLSLQSEYFLRHDIEALPQGKRYNEQEMLMLGANYRLLKNRMSVSAYWCIPTSLIDKRTYTKISIPGFRSETYGDDRINASLIQVSVRYSFGKGKVSKNSNSYALDDEK